MEGGDPGFFFEAFSEEIGGPFEHFAGGLVGEGDGEDAVGLCSLADEFGHAVGDDARLPGPCSGEDEERAFDGEDGFALGGVEVGESIHAGIVKGFTTHWDGPNRVVKQVSAAVIVRESNLTEWGEDVKLSRLTWGIMLKRKEKVVGL